jgi:hypothetical protein
MWGMPAAYTGTATGPVASYTMMPNVFMPNTAWFLQLAGFTAPMDANLAAIDAAVAAMPDWQTNRNSSVFPSALQEWIESSPNCRDRTDEQQDDFDQYHIALGLDDVARESGSPVSLNAFTYNLNQRYPHPLRGPRSRNTWDLVHNDRTWYIPSRFRNGIPLSLSRPFPGSFYEALSNIGLGRVIRIHFNLEGILGAEASSYRDYATHSGNSGVYIPPTVPDSERVIVINGVARPFRVTAWELYNIVSMPNVCRRMTSFYLHGTSNVEVEDVAIKTQICG